MITPSLEAALNLAFEDANKREHEFVTLEHLLLALLTDPDAVVALKACEADIDELKEQIDEYLDSQEKKVDQEAPSEPTLALNRTIQRAVIHAQGSSRQEVNGADILIHLYSEEESYAVYLLESQEITKMDFLNYISHGITKSGEEQFGQYEMDLNEEEGASYKSGKSALEEFTNNLNQRALDGKVDPLIGRAIEVERLMQILCRRKKNNPILVGEAGVGKTAIVEGFAHKIILEEIPELLKDAVVYSLDLGTLLAGTKFRGDFEARIKSLLKEIQAIPNAILFIDEIHTLIGAGATEGAMDASNMLKPLLSSGEIKCIGSTTYEEFRNVFAKNSALARRFQKIDIPEPSTDDTVKVLAGLKSRFEKHHNVKYSPASLQAAAELSEKYIHDRFLPDKAIDLIDEAGAANRLLSKNKQKTTINEKDIEALVSKQAKIPSKTVKRSLKEKLKNLERDLKILIFGQDEAITKVSNAIKLSQSGLTTQERPIGCFLFAGPTGVGKTELAKQLANSMGINFLRFDMSEYMEKHAVSRLIGAPPGYVGYDQGGLLTEAVIKQPYSVLLLDEIEKAHVDINNILLQVFDYGFLTDNNGKKADFRNCIIILTSNAGAREQSKNSIGFNPNADTGEFKKAIERAFSPEFINRLDSVIQFNNLQQAHILQVVDKFLIELEKLLTKKQVSIQFSQEVRAWIARAGYDPKFGARPIQRLIQEKVKKPLVEELLFGKLENGGLVNVSLDKKEALSFQFTKKLAKKKEKKPSITKTKK